MSKPVILTGLRANSEFHIGNFLGAIKPMVDLQKAHAGTYQVNMFVPDLHSFTTPIDHGTLYQQSIDNLRVFIAAGLKVDSPDTFIYRQSYIPAHSELAWILGCFTYYGELSRMTQFKDKALGSKNSEEGLSAGLFNYPVLMAADILLYDAIYIPLGDDQKQHLELARNIATRMNNRFGDLFTIPLAWEKQLEFSNLASGVRVRSLRNPEKKMSKSVSDPSGTIMLSDAPKDAAKKVMSATTDNLSDIHYDWDKQPGITNLLQILALLTYTDQEIVNDQWKGKKSYSELKQRVAEVVEDFLEKLQADLKKINDKDILKILEADEVDMNKVANKTLYKVQKAIGLRPN
jgi:tryptophanyl-tRNA synthetase